MLSAPVRPRAPSPRAHPVRGAVAIALSALLHAGALMLLLPHSPGRGLPQAVPPLEIEMVQQEAQVRGAPPPPEPAPAPEATAAAASQPSPPAPPVPQAAQAPAAPPSAPSRPARQQTPAKQAAPAVNLGNAGEDFDPLIVTGENVVPPAPDARYRNLPPHYPASAAKTGAEGTVQLVARISPTGQPLSVGIVTSSGNADLDEEARRAVLLWRFRPARAGGAAVPYDYVVNIRFTMGDR